MCARSDRFQGVPPAIIKLTQAGGRGLVNNRLGTLVGVPGASGGHFTALIESRDGVVGQSLYNPTVSVWSRPGSVARPGGILIEDFLPRSTCPTTKQDIVAR